MIGIYSIRNVQNGDCYVGQTIDIERRKRAHFATSSNYYISHAMRKYGKAAFVFEVLEVCSEEMLDDRECHWIAALDCIRPNGYNLLSGGANGRHTQETREKMSQSSRGEKNPQWGKPLSEEHRKKLSKALKGKTHTPETKKHLSKVLRGKGNGMFGKKQSKETLAKLSEALKGEKNGMFGRKHTPESIRKMSETKRKRRAERQARENDRQLKLF